MKKKIFLFWDLDGAIGQINSTYPYNFSYQTLEDELENVRYVIEKLESYKVRACFAITGFSAEDGKYPYVFPDLIAQIHEKGHEVASHSWRHEWAPFFTRKQIHLSLSRSKFALEKSIANSANVVGFVPPHNRPMSWLGRGAFSFGDRGLFPFFQMGDNSQLLKELELTGYTWVRISHQNLLQKIGVRERNVTGRVYKHKGIVVFENHYNGFDHFVISRILDSDHLTYTVSAHPLMLNLQNKIENKENFERFLDTFSRHRDSVEFMTPRDYIENEGLKPDIAEIKSGLGSN